MRHSGQKISQLFFWCIKGNFKLIQISRATWLSADIHLKSIQWDRSEGMQGKVAVGFVCFSQGPRSELSPFTAGQSVGVSTSIEQKADPLLDSDRVIRLSCYFRRHFILID